MTGIGQERTRVGVAGLGTMGTPIAERLLAAGYRTTVWNRTAARGAALVEAGAASAASPAALARAAETVVVCVTDTAAVEDVVFGSDGIVAGAQPGLLLVDTSSIDPVATRDLARRFAAACGGRWVDAPVSGGEAGARA
ncbi:MAG: NAD(P)-dependent oxidoreductase, partial [Alphaproteobacteria bacterium]|nr:NAD(P)-dependent oxidoreductase [Alphaproteobacteria bacterium]